MNNLLITGATGFMGRATVAALLDEFPCLHIHAIVRPPKNGKPEDRPELAAVARHPRLHLMAGDCVQPGLGLAGNHPEQIDACIHLAASTEFKESLRAETFRINVDGTRNLLEFLSVNHPSAKLYHVSTAYVCGYSNGRSPEALFPAPDRGFLNPYEESKHAAEHLVAASGLNWTILRPSIIVGHSETGWAESDKMMYGCLKSFKRFRDLLSNKYSEGEINALSDRPFRVYAKDETPKSYICIDDVMRLTLGILRVSPSKGTVFHLTNPKPSSIGNSHRAFCDVLNIPCLQQYPEPLTELAIEEKILDRGMEV